MANKNNRFAVGLIVNKENRILMGKRNDTGKWTTPGGGIKCHECPFKAMKRELKEETGLDAISIKMIRAKFDKEKLIYLFEIKINFDQRINTLKDPDLECKTWSYENPFKHIKSLHVPSEKNIVIDYLSNN